MVTDALFGSNMMIAGDKLLPLLMILAYTFFPLLIGSLSAKRAIPSLNDYFVYGRGMGTSLTFFTVYATWWSSFAYLGSTSYFYSTGSVYWSAMGWNVFFGVLFMVFGWRINAYGRGLDIVTPPQFFNSIFNSKLVNIAIVVIMVLFTIPYLQIQMYGSAIMIEIATDGVLPWKVNAFLFYLVMIVYLWIGGLRAVAWADVFYAILIFCGMVISGLVLIRLSGGIEATFDQIIRGAPEMILLSETPAPSSIPQWTAMFLMVPLGALMSPAMWLRMFAPKGKSVFRIMPLLLSVAAFAYLGSALSGNAAAVIEPNIVNSDTVLPLMLKSYVPTWLMTIILCCGTAACLSTANAEVHAISALLVLDIYKPFFHRGASEKRLVRISKVTIIAFSALAWLTLIFSRAPGSIISTGLTALCGLAQIAVPTIGALFWSRANIPGVISGLLLGCGAMLILPIIHPQAMWIHPGLVGLLLNGAAFFLCGWILPPDQDTSERISLFKRGMFE